jgi:hypothetical protein
MFGNKKLKLQIENLQKELNSKKEIFNYNEIKIKDDFNVLNEVLDLKISNYEEVMFVYNRYQEDKKVNVSTEEIDKATRSIIKDTIMSLSERYVNYLCTKYFKSEEALVDVYTQRVYMRLFKFANDYNINRTQSDFKNNK